MDTNAEHIATYEEPTMENMIDQDREDEQGINIDDDDDDENVELIDDEPDAIIKWSFTGCIKSQQCTTCIYLAITMITLSCLAATIVECILVVVPYTMARMFHSAICSPVSVTWDKDVRHCTCGKQCHSDFTCVRINVTLYPPIVSRHNDTSSIALLKEDESLMKHQVS